MNIIKQISLGSYISEFASYLFCIQRLHKCFTRYHVITRTRWLLTFTKSFPSFKRKLCNCTSPFERQTIWTVVLWPWALCIRVQGALMLGTSDSGTRIVLQLSWSNVKNVIRWAWALFLLGLIFFSNVISWPIKSWNCSVVFIWTWTLSALQARMLYLVLSESIADRSGRWLVQDSCRLRSILLRSRWLWTSKRFCSLWFLIILWKPELRNDSYSSPVHICVDWTIILRSRSLNNLFHLASFRAHRAYLPWEWHSCTASITYNLSTICIIRWPRSYAPVPVTFRRISNGCSWSISFSWVWSMFRHWKVPWVLVWTRGESLRLDKESFGTTNSRTWTTFKEFHGVRLIGLWTGFALVFCYFSFEFNSNWLMSSTNLARYSVHRRSRAHTLMNLCSNQAVKFRFSLDMMRWPSRKNSLEFISSRPRTQSIVRHKSLFLRNGGIHCSCRLRSLSLHPFALTACSWENAWVSSNGACVMSGVEVRPIRPTSCFSN